MYKMTAIQLMGELQKMNPFAEVYAMNDKGVYRRVEKVMKCDELQYERLGDANKTYPASTLVVRKQFVDAAIAELKCELSDARADNEKLKEALKIKDDLLIENGAEIGSLKADNESLRKAVSDWHDKYCSLQETIDRLECKLECVKENKDKELRATRRALWLARAERALSDYAWHQQTAETLLRGGTSAAVDYQKWKAKKWKNVERLCRAKAEEYK